MEMPEYGRSSHPGQWNSKKNPNRQSEKHILPTYAFGSGKDLKGILGWGSAPMVKSLEHFPHPCHQKVESASRSGMKQRDDDERAEFYEA